MDTRNGSNLLTDGSRTMQENWSGSVLATLPVAVDGVGEPCLSRVQSEAAFALEELETRINSRVQWKLEKNEDGILCYSTDGNGRKIWKSEILLETSPDSLWRLLYHGLQRVPEWNSQVLLEEVVHNISDTTDIMYTVTDSVGPVSSRDFVSVRTWSLKNGCHYIALMATTFHAKPTLSDKVRGENGPSGYAIIPEGPNKTKLIWINDINAKVQSWLPQSLVNKAFRTTLITANKKLRSLLKKNIH